MLDVLLAILIVLVIFVLVFLGWLAKGYSAARQEAAGLNNSVVLLQQQLEAIRTSQDKRTETLEKNLQTGQASIGKFLQANQETLARLGSQLGGLEKSSQQMLQLGADVRGLQDILKAPKMRGQLGEWSLENLLEEVLPKNGFDLQHTFNNGKVVDAIVRTGKFLVPIDAKFPLPSFEGMLKAESEDAKAALRRQFQKDVKNHIDKISASYINPAEETLDFALMYIPAENVYYETVVKQPQDREDIVKYSLDKKVIAVSPNLLYTYLMTVAMGLHGLQIERQAAEIRKNLGRLAMDFGGFAESWGVLGRHLRNAQGQYDEGQKKLDRFSMQLEQLEISEREKNSKQLEGI